MADDVTGLTIELLSPCFLGGAHQQPEFRLGSLRGVWRYWYRALYGDGSETGANRAVEDETELFGGVFGDDVRIGRARLVPRVPTGGLKRGAAAWSRTRVPGGQKGPGRDYLLFTMDMNQRNQRNQRRFLAPGQAVRLDCRVRGPVASTIVERAQRSLAAALAFGGLGARSRRMAGAVHLTANAPHPIFPAQPASDSAALARRLKDLIAPALVRTLQPARYHVVARDQFVAGVLRKAYGRWEDALDEVGSALRDFRWRRQPDYEIAKNLAQGRPVEPGKTIGRAAFGLPLSFRFSSLRGAPPVMIQLPGSDRRGSPLFLTLERLQQGKLAVVWCLFHGPLGPGRIAVRNRQIQMPEPDQGAIDALLREPAWSSHMITE